MSEAAAHQGQLVQDSPDQSPQTGIGSFRELLDAIPDLAVILNSDREAVFVNRSLRDWIGQDRFHKLTGQKTGELIGCIHHLDAPGGCGEGEACQFCGTNTAIQNAMTTARPATGECRLTIERQGRFTSLDLRIGAYPYHHRHRLYLVVTISDISDQKRRLALERIFFHDIINTAGGLKGLLEVMGHLDDPAEIQALIKDANMMGDQLLEEIRAQKELSQAENNELSVHIDSHLVGTMIREAVQMVSHHRIAERHKISIVSHPMDPSLIIETDRQLFVRIVVNMLKNGIEASAPEGQVQIHAEVNRAGSPHLLQVSVQNAGMMSREVQLQLFQRSFSTKGSNRGLGTYSMKLLAERYLQGRIQFESSLETGTRFTLELPLEAASKASSKSPVEG